jgi:hypothetical protein
LLSQKLSGLLSQFRQGEVASVVRRSQIPSVFAGVQVLAKLVTIDAEFLRDGVHTTKVGFAPHEPPSAKEEMGKVCHALILVTG